MSRLDQDLLNALLSRALVTKPGIELVHEIRNGEPLEPKPRIRQGRTRGSHISTRMNFAVRCNDTTLQFSLLHELDDPHSDCIEFYSWPTDIGGVRYPVSNGTRVQVDVFRPFLLKISENWCGFVDVFPNAMLKKGVTGGSGLYEEVSPGHWVSSPIAERLSHYGLKYQILTETHFGPWYLLNVGFLSPYRGDSYSVMDPAACETVLSMVAVKGYLSRRELIEQNIIGADDLNYLIITRRVYFPLGTQDVTDIRSCIVFRDIAAYESFKAAKAANIGFLSLDIEKADADSKGDKPDPEPGFLQFVSPAAYDFAHRKLASLAEKISYWWRGSGPKREGRPIPPQTKAEWQSQAELGRLLYDSEVFGLIPNWRARGHKAPKYPESEKLWDHVYLKYRLLKRFSIRATWAMFVAIAKRLGLEQFSYRTARKRDEECEKSVFVQFRDGSSARYAIAGFAPPGTANRLYKCAVPFTLAHIDHTPLLIRLENSANGRRIKSQVWLTVMIDAATGQKLAWTLSFNAPSAAAVTTVLFECVKEHKCLPRFIVVDNAPEFDSLVMHRILQEAESHLVWRPAYHPRYGAPVEAANNKITTQLLQQLTGNTVAVKDLYAYSRTFIARNPELMTLTQLHAHLKGVFSEVEMEHGSAKTGDESIRDYVARYKREYGDKYRKPIELTLSFRRLCMPPASGNGMRVVRDEGYVVVKNLAYWDTGDDLKRFRGRRVRVFPDVIHPGLVYIYVDNQTGWITGRSIYADFFALYSKREILGVMAELKLGRLQGVRDPVKISVALAEKLLELEKDPARKDTLTKQLEMLLNRAPSLLQTEEQPENYFSAPPVPGTHPQAEEGADVSPKSAQNAASKKSSAPDVSATGSPQSQSDSARQNAVGAVPTGAIAPDMTTTETQSQADSDAHAPADEDDDDDLVPIVRPNRLSF
ncbi:hypothetical protein P3T18_002979 [Paraburkholderia sp. GAS199]|uniref:integrase catalytic domain-containing protein n=1 Tax=Paraburkholderia sp. GAS199 TaxID=3035126 RepID=UPI003D211928